METLKRRCEFRHLKDSGRFIKPVPWLVINYKPNQEGITRLGVTTSRQVEKSVYRNRLKRWSKEFFKGSEDLGLDINLIFRKVSADNFYRTLKHEELKSYFTQSLQTIRQRLKK